MLSPLILPPIKFLDDSHDIAPLGMPPHATLTLDLSAIHKPSNLPVHSPGIIGPASASESFFTSKSRVIKLFNLPVNDAHAVIAHSFKASNLPLPLTMWTIADIANTVFATFRSHQEACLVLSIPTPQLSMSHALETELLPFSKLSRFKFASSASHASLLLSATQMPLSTNPPSSATFRPMDWLCPSRQCGAHNFARNLSCIGCNCPRSSLSPRHQSAPSLLPSPRFGGFQQSPSPSSPSYPHGQPNKSSHGFHPTLTPSGRAFAQGGRVQNVSSDPLAPCVMFWPADEPLPIQSQIRPSGHATSPQPPILNTGNRGPIEHQPGDWICGACNYLNWRRRKVCQTCFPYAEGNSDTVSAATQAERIALLTSMLAQQQAPMQEAQNNTFAYHQHRRQPILRSHSLTPPATQRHFLDVSPPKPQHLLHHPAVHRSQSHLDIGAQYAQQPQQPIYQTSDPRTLRASPIAMHAPIPLLPSFLHEMVDVSDSPNLSPTSTCSGGLSSSEEYDEAPSDLRGRQRYPMGVLGSSLSVGSGGNSRPSSCLPSPVGSIWSMGSDELGLGFPSSSVSRKSSRDSLLAVPVRIGL